MRRTLLLLALSGCWPYLSGSYDDYVDDTDVDTESESDSATETDTETETETETESQIPVVTIQDLHAGKVAEGELVIVDDAVVIGTAPDGWGFWVQQPGRRVNAGIYVFFKKRDWSTRHPTVDIGKTVRVQARFQTYDGGGTWDADLAELYLDEDLPEHDLVVESSSTVPSPVELPVRGISAASLADDYQGMLVKVGAVEVVSLEAGGEAIITDGDEQASIDDEAWPWPETLDVGARDSFTGITGVLHVTEDGFRLEPRRATDFRGHKKYQPPGELTVDDLVAGDLIVTEFSPNPYNGADEYCEWVEIYNNAGEDIQLLGLQLHNIGSELGEVTEEAVLSAGSYGLMLKANATERAGTCLFDTGFPSGVTKVHYGRKIHFSNSTAEPAVLKRPDGTIIDQTAASKDTVIQLNSISRDHLLNDDKANWCWAISEFWRAGDLFERGTPGAANDRCPV